MQCLNRFSRQKIAKNTLVLVVAELAMRVLGIVYVASLARYVGTSGVGAISTATALTTIVAILIGPGLETLLVRDVARDRTQVGPYLSTMLFLKACLAVPFFLVIIAIVHTADYPAQVVPIIYAYAVLTVLDALGSIFASVFQAFERMEFQATAVVLRDSINILLSLLFIYFHLSLLMIVFVSVLATACKFLFMGLIVYKRFAPSRPALSLTVSWRLLIASFPFAFYIILVLIRFQLGTLILSLYRTPEQVGVYSAAFSLVMLSLFIPNAFSTAIFPTFSDLHKRSTGGLQDFYRVCFKYLLLLGFPLGVGTVLLGDKVILLVFGDKFQGSVGVVRILAIYMFTFVGYCNGPLLNATGRQRFFAWTQAAAVALNALIALLLVPRFGPEGAAAAFVAAAVATFFVHSIASHRQVSLPVPWVTIGQVCLATLFMGAAAIIFLQLGVFWPVVLVIVAPLTYCLTVFLFGMIKRREIRLLLGNPQAMARINSAPAPV